MTSINRRNVLAGSLATAASLTIPARVFAASESPFLSASAVDLTERVAGFLSLLDENQRRRVGFASGGSEWRRWNYFGGGNLIKPGLRLEEMNDAQKDATWTVLATVLSPDGLEKARNVMLLQDILAAAGNGASIRSSQRFSIAVFGTPSATGEWGLRLEGHHLSLSFSVRDGQIVSVTPAAFAALPNRVTSGRHRGLNTLQGEEKLARRLQSDLAPAMQARAQVRDRHLFNILSSAGRERANTSKVGLAAAEMTSGQREILRALIETYAVEPYAGPLRDAQKLRLAAADLNAVHFAWYGPNVEERSFGYRIISDQFVIELGCIDRQAQHLHPVYHDLGNTLGTAA